MTSKKDKKLEKVIDWDDDGPFIFWIAVTFAFIISIIFAPIISLCHFVVNFERVYSKSRHVYWREIK